MDDNSLEKITERLHCKFYEILLQWVRNLNLKDKKKIELINDILAFTGRQITDRKLTESSINDETIIAIAKDFIDREILKSNIASEKLKESQIDDFIKILAKEKYLHFDLLVMQYLWKRYDKVKNNPRAKATEIKRLICFCAFYYGEESYKSVSQIISLSSALFYNYLGDIREDFILYLKNECQNLIVNDGKKLSIDKSAIDKYVKNRLGRKNRNDQNDM